MTTPQEFTCHVCKKRVKSELNFDHGGDTCNHCHEIILLRIKDKPKKWWAKKMVTTNLIRNQNKRPKTEEEKINQEKNRPQRTGQSTQWKKKLLHQNDLTYDGRSWRVEK